jgi:hypothetical protein
MVNWWTFWSIRKITLYWLRDCQETSGVRHICTNTDLMLVCNLRIHFLYFLVSGNVTWLDPTVKPTALLGTTSVMTPPPPGMLHLCLCVCVCVCTAFDKQAYLSCFSYVHRLICSLATCSFPDMFCNYEPIVFYIFIVVTILYFHRSYHMQFC